MSRQTNAATLCEQRLCEYFDYYDRIVAKSILFRLWNYIDKLFIVMKPNTEWLFALRFFRHGSDSGKHVSHSVGILARKSAPMRSLVANIRTVFYRIMLVGVSLCSDRFRLPNIRPIPFESIQIWIFSIVSVLFLKRISFSLLHWFCTVAILMFFLTISNSNNDNTSRR